MDLAGKAALITGAARGIGYETARSLVRRGASVAILDLEQEAAEAAADSLQPKAQAAGSAPTPQVIGIGADVADAGAVERAVQQAIDQLGGLDICVANAGIAPQAATAKAMDPAVFDRVIEVNLLGVWRTVRAALPAVTERRGHLVLISSIYAFTNGSFVSPYACSKAAVEQLGRALRVELSIHGVTVTVAYFGFVDTEMVRQGYEQDELASRFESFVPKRLRQRITPADAGEAIVSGVEQRRPRVIEPRQWAPLFALQGISGPLSDRLMSRSSGLQALTREADDPGRSSGRRMTETASADRPGER